MNSHRHSEASNTEKGFHSVVMIFSVLLILIALFLSGVALHGAVYGEQATREVLAKYGIDLYNLNGQKQLGHEVPEFAAGAESEAERPQDVEDIKGARELEQLREEYEAQQWEQQQKVNSAVQMEAEGQIPPPRLKNLPKEETFYEDDEDIEVIDLDVLEPTEEEELSPTEEPVLETPEEMIKD